MQRFFFVLSAALLVTSSPANAGVLITSRTSHLVTTIDFGFIGNVTSSIDFFIYSTIDDTQLVRQGSATDGGPVGDVSWDASYEYSVEQQLVPGSAQGFSGSGGAGLFSFAGGEGVSFLASTNRLEVEFENTIPTDFDLTFIGTDSSRIELERMTGPGVWEDVYAHPGGFDEIEMTLRLEQAVFRLTAETVVSTDNGFSNGGSWSFSMSAVPEPPSIVPLSISALWLRTRIRRQAH